jgi:hypothetical protein
MTAERLDDPATDRVVADDRERADRDGAAELVAIAVMTHGISSPRAARATA